MAPLTRFTEGAQKALALAQEAARRLGNNYVGTEHILLGLILEGNGPAAHALANAGITSENVEEAVIKLLGKGDYTFNENFDFTSRSKRVIEMSVIEARNMQNNYVGTEHILIALLKETEGVAVRIILMLGGNIEKILDDLRKEEGEIPDAHGKAPSGYTDTKTLNQYSRDLNKAAENGELDPVIGRAKEIERIIQILSRRTKNNPVLIGEPGVGKSAIAEGLAQRIVEGNIPELLKNKRVVSLDIAAMLAGAKFRGEFEERLKNALSEIKKAGN
ncbi:MAG TPA: Clp protease N-terminal domain-containing protein, partial [Clostridia bacterium]|nr:Clp protease N-terminal domain-containing protein [Clostridia bacterium]